MGSIVVLEHYEQKQLRPTSQQPRYGATRGAALVIGVLLPRSNGNMYITNTGPRSLPGFRRCDEESTWPGFNLTEVALGGANTDCQHGRVHLGQRDARSRLQRASTDAPRPPECNPPSAKTGSSAPLEFFQSVSDCVVITDSLCFAFHKEDSSAFGSWHRN